MKIKPLGDRVVVKPAKAEEQTKSGLFIPDTAQEKPQKGEVVAVGEGRWDDAGQKRIPIDVKVGDMVLYSKYGGHDFKVDDEEYKVLESRDLFGIVE